jgi:hypothetical protein
MPDAMTLPSAHELVRRIEAEARPGGAWTYDADPSWSQDAAIVFPERILLRVSRNDETLGYAWQMERWNPSDETYQPVTGQTGQAANPGEMAAVAVAFIDEHNIGEPVPVTVYPLAEELGERIQAGYPRAHWQHYVNDVYAFVFEYPNERRLAFWDEADFMGSIDGYTWVQEEFSPAENRWMTVAASSDMVSLGQLRRTVAEFNDTGEAAYRSPAETPDARVAARSLPARAGRPDAGDELVRRLSERAAALTDDERGLAAPARTSSRPGPGR